MFSHEKVTSIPSEAAWLYHVYPSYLPGGVKLRHMTSFEVCSSLTPNFPPTFSRKTSPLSEQTSLKMATGLIEYRLKVSCSFCDNGITRDNSAACGQAWETFLLHQSYTGIKFKFGLLIQVFSWISYFSWVVEVRREICARLTCSHLKSSEVSGLAPA